MDGLLEATDGVVDVNDAGIMLMSVALVLTRMLAFSYMSPFFGNKSMSRTVRVGFLLALSIVVAPPVFEQFKLDSTLQDRFLLLMVKEVIIGLVLGALVWMPIYGLELAGVLLDTQRGSTMAQDFNVIFNSPQATPTAILLSQIFSGFFFAVGGLLLVETILFESMNIWPPSEPLPPLQDDIAILFGNFAGSLLLTAVVFVLPISGFMLVADIGIAFAARAAPSLNALTLGMPVKSAVMIFMLYFYIEIAFPRLVSGLGDTTDLVRMVLQK